MSASGYSFLTDGTFTLPYKSYGNGDELLLCFHGFGRSADDFHRFEAGLGHKYTLIAFDFLYHGPHAVAANKRLPVFTPNVLSDMVEKLLWEKKKVRCSLMGYSQGGKTVMGLIHKIPHRVNELFVLAPDGMKNNRVRNFIGSTHMGRWLGLYLVKSPNALHKIIKGLHSLKFLSEKVKSFYISNTDNIEKRYKIYHSWLTLRKYELHPHTMNHYFHAKKIRVEFFIGKYDAIITPHSAHRFLKKFNYKIRLHELECGHDLLAFHSQIEKIILASTKAGK
jgi:pimeloyl-ACP methyl ester carboxylesterase